MTVPGRGVALYERSDLGAPQAQVHHRVQALLPLEHHPVAVFAIQHQLGCHQIDLRQTQSLWARFL